MTNKAKRFMLALLLPVVALFGVAGRALADGETYQWPILSVVDGDTIRVILSPMPPLFKKNSVRVDGVDTPETKGKCKAERELAAKAKKFTTDEIRRAKVVEFSNIKKEKYGRVLARVTIDGRDLADLLIAEGLARPYSGEKRKGWCN